MSFYCETDRVEDDKHRNKHVKRPVYAQMKEKAIKRVIVRSYARARLNGRFVNESVIIILAIS